MKRTFIIILAAMLIPASASAAGCKGIKTCCGCINFIGKCGNIVNLKKDKCWDPFYPYRAPGWC